VGRRLRDDGTNHAFLPPVDLRPGFEGYSDVELVESGYRVNVSLGQFQKEVRMTPRFRPILVGSAAVTLCALATFYLPHKTSFLRGAAGQEAPSSTPPPVAPNDSAQARAAAQEALFSLVPPVASDAPPVASDFAAFTMRLARRIKDSNEELLKSLPPGLKPGEQVTEYIEVLSCDLASTQSLSCPVQGTVVFRLEDLTPNSDGTRVQTFTFGLVNRKWACIKAVQNYFYEGDSWDRSNWKGEVYLARDYYSKPIDAAQQ
jgi:hypothetical protein